MKAIDFVNMTNLEDFECCSDITICFKYQKYYKRYGIMMPKKNIEETTFFRINLCEKSKWKQYVSYDSFANKEVVKIDNDGGLMTIYCHFDVDELIKEFVGSHGGEKYCSIVKIKWIKNMVKDTVEYF